jgi:hypothetical protein
LVRTTGYTFAKQPHAQFRKGSIILKLAGEWPVASVSGAGDHFGDLATKALVDDPLGFATISFALLFSKLEGYLRLARR